jgi:hypothetical protein
LIERYPIEKNRIDGILDLMVDVYLQETGTIVINRQEKPIALVKS